MALKHGLKRRGVRRGFRKMLNVRSRSEPLVQIADVVAGAILRNITREDSDSISALQPQVRLLYQFQPQTKNPPS